MKALDNRFYVEFMQLEIGLFRQRQRPILSQNKAISGKDDCSSTCNRFVFVLWSWSLL